MCIWRWWSVNEFAFLIIFHLYIVYFPQATDDTENNLIFWRLIFEKMHHQRPHAFSSSREMMILGCYRCFLLLYECFLIWWGKRNYLKIEQVSFNILKIILESYMGEESVEINYIFAFCNKSISYLFTNYTDPRASPFPSPLSEQFHIMPYNKTLFYSWIVLQDIVQKIDSYNLWKVFSNFIKNRLYIRAYTKKKVFFLYVLWFN